MITPKIKQILRYRMYFMHYFCFAAEFGWDPVLEELTPPKKYLYWNVLLLLKGSDFFLCYFTVYLLLQLSDISQMIEAATQHGDIRFTSYLFAWVENSLFLILILTAYQIRRQTSQIIYLTNQMVKYSKILEASLQIPPTKQKQYQDKLRHGEHLFMTMAIPCYILPPLCGFFLMYAEFEPAHKLAEEFFEVKFEFSLKFIPMSILATWGLSSVASIVFNGMMPGVLYILFSTTYLSYLLPESVHVSKLNSRSSATLQYKVTTQLFGVIPDNKLISMYRAQQVVNLLVNQIYASHCISMHHVICLVVFVGLAFTLLSVQDVVATMGTHNFLLLCGCICCVIALQYIECVKLGHIYDISEAFVKKGKKLVRRNTMLFKFLESCRALEIQTAYPYFTVRRKTFAEFLNHGIGFIITLLTI